MFQFHARNGQRVQPVKIVPGETTHLFEEPGTLEEVARLAGEWFQRRLILNDVE